MSVNRTRLFLTSCVALIMTAMVFYMILVFLISRGFRIWEKHWLAHLRPREIQSA